MCEWGGGGEQAGIKSVRGQQGGTQRLAVAGARRVLCVVCVCVWGAGQVSSGVLLLGSFVTGAGCPPCHGVAGLPRLACGTCGEVCCRQVLAAVPLAPDASGLPQACCGLLGCKTHRKRDTDLPSVLPGNEEVRLCGFSHASARSCWLWSLFACDLALRPPPLGLRFVVDPQHCNL